MYVFAMKYPMNPQIRGAIINENMRKEFPMGPVGIGPPRIALRRKPVAKKVMGIPRVAMPKMNMMVVARFARLTLGLGSGNL